MELKDEGNKQSFFDQEVLKQKQEIAKMLVAKYQTNLQTAEKKTDFKNQLNKNLLAKFGYKAEPPIK